MMYEVWQICKLAEVMGLLLNRVIRVAEQRPGSSPSYILKQK
jgi:hypothetical protein